MFKFSKRSLKNLEGVHPDLVKVVHKALELTPIDFIVIDGVRTEEEQANLYAQGRSKSGPIVTWTLASRHLNGKAIDFAAWVDGKVDFTYQNYPPIIAAFKKAAKELGISIVCGLDWITSSDPGHIELDKEIYA